MVRIFNEVLGSEVDVPEKPKRVVSFSPALTEGMFKLGVGGSLVGVSAFCARPPEAKERRRVGSYNTVRYEVLDELKPDLILTVTGYQREFAVKLAERYTVYPLELPVSVAGIVDAVARLGLVVGEEESGSRLAYELLRSLAEMKRTTRVRAYVEIDLGGPVTFGAVSYITDAVRMLGSETLFDGLRKEWLEPDLGAIPAMDPDLIVYERKMFSQFEMADLRRLVERRGWDGMRAVKSGNLFLTPGPLDFLAHHGPSFVTESMPWLSASLKRAAENC